MRIMMDHNRRNPNSEEVNSQDTTQDPNRRGRQKQRPFDYARSSSVNDISSDRERLDYRQGIQRSKSMSAMDQVREIASQIMSEHGGESESDIDEKMYQFYLEAEQIFDNLKNENEKMAKKIPDLENQIKWLADESDETGKKISDLKNQNKWLADESDKMAKKISDLKIKISG